MPSVLLTSAMVLARILLGFVLLFAGIAKAVQESDRLAASVEAYRIVPRRFAQPLAVGLPIAEAILGLSLLAGLFMPAPALAAGLLLASFALAMALNLLRGRAIPCACFGVTTNEVISWNRVLLDLTLVVAAWIASGWWWSAQWRWPLALVPNGTTIRVLDAAAAMLDAAGILLVLVLGKAGRSLIRMRHGGAVREPDRLHATGEGGRAMTLALQVRGSKRKIL